MALFGLFKSSKDAANQSGPQGGIPVRSVLRYTHMPEILPRIRAIGGKLGHFAYMLALVYRSARLLPANHPMLNPANIGRYGITDVIATAANGLVMKRENMDQILIFATVILAFVMIAIQAVLICVYAFFSSAHAADGSMFTTPSPNTDLAYEFMRNVFGVPDMFGSGTSVIGQPGFHAVLGMYSQAMMIVAVVIVVYYVITVVGEAAQTGTPFGRRFNGLWAPVRLILALGLLVPLGSNLNAAQYLTLNVAKLGSGLATNAWMAYSDKFLTAQTSGRSSTPSMSSLGQAVFAAESCRAAYNQVNNKAKFSKVKILVQRGNTAKVATFDESDVTNIPPDAKTVTYVWTTQDASQGVITDPTCGTIALPVAAKGNSSDPVIQYVDVLAQKIQVDYVKILGNMLNGISGANATTNPTNESPAGQFAKKSIATNSEDWVKASGTSVDPIAIKVAGVIDAAQVAANGLIKTSVFENKSLTDALSQKMKKDAKEKGWMSAGIYYSEMSKGTQMIYDAINKNFPSPQAPAKGSSGVEEMGMMDKAWEWVTGGATASTKEVRTMLLNIPAMTGRIESKLTEQPADVRGQKPRAEESIQSAFNSGWMSRPMLSLGKWLFGDALIVMVDEPTLNPMSSLLQAGSYILDRSNLMFKLYIGSLLASQAGIIGAVAISALISPVGGIVMMAVAKFITAAGGLIYFFLIIGMAAGIILFYILPLMPMMYFFFSAVNWVIEVAEAFVSMPLFALAHLRIDGDGLPGQVAYNGWLTLFGVMLRPILIIIGFIVGSLIFNAGAYYLGKIYKYAIFAYRPETSGASGGGIDFDKIGFFGIFIYIILFVYMIYLLANSSFKLIDQIPDKAMRWIGGQQPFTGDRPVDIGNMQSVAIAGYAAMKEGKGAIDSLSSFGKDLRPEDLKGLKGAFPKGRGTVSTGTPPSNPTT